MSEQSAPASSSVSFLAWISLSGIILFVAGAFLVWFTLGATWPFAKPVGSDSTNLDYVVERTARSLLNGDRNELRHLSSNRAWKCFSDSYEFAVAVFGYQGTFDDYLRSAGKELNDAAPNDVTQNNLGPELVLFRFCPNATPEGVTLAFRRIGDHWQLAYFSFGEIDPESVREEASK